MDKPTEIRVMGRLAAEAFTSDLPYIMISITDPKSEQPYFKENPFCLATMYLQFSDYDATSKDIISGDKCLNAPEYTLFTPNDAKAIIQLIEHIYPYINLIVVHCEAGVSRSAAIAAAISRMQGKSDAEYFNPQGRYIPNRFVYRTFLNVANEAGYNTDEVTNV
jgi:predicted protein tyrosine phosphatase